MNKKILSLFLLTLLFSMPTLVGATTFQEIISSASDSLALASGSLAIIGFMVAGIMFITATGNPSRMTIAKSALVAAVIGIVIVVLAKTAEGVVALFFGLPLEAG